MSNIQKLGAAFIITHVFAFLVAGVFGLFTCYMGWRLGMWLNPEWKDEWINQN